MRPDKSNLILKYNIYNIMKKQILIKNYRIDKKIFIHGYYCMYETRKLKKLLLKISSF